MGWLIGLSCGACRALRTLQKLEDYWITINDIENRADAAYRTLLAELFDSELESSP